MPSEINTRFYQEFLTGGRFRRIQQLLMDINEEIYELEEEYSPEGSGLDVLNGFDDMNTGMATIDYGIMQIREALEEELE